MSQVQVFPASASVKRAVSRRAYGLFVGGLGLLVCGVSGTAALLAVSARPRPLLLALAGGVACVGTAGLIVGIVSLLNLRQPIQVEVTPHRLVWREGKRLATLEYDEVERVELVREEKRLPDGMLMYYPVVRFIENDGEMMEFEVSFEDRGMIHRGRFDARAIAAAVLPYLRQTAIITPAVDEFVRTGMVDIESLPER
ncbi:MAG TPA: hypothetical protein ENI95_12990 [Chloroflexi bacterium]|nr:hypothetical protein [Chloroflexota bacterium]